MSLLSRLTEKSWVPPAVGAAETVDPADYRPPAARVGMVVYFGVITVLFGLVSSAYMMRMGMPGMGHGHAADWRPMPEPPLIWINTAVLVMNSIAWEVARAGARGGGDVMRTGLHAAGALGLLFIAGQLLLWRQFVDTGYLLQANPANAFFYLITALHGLHLIGGLFFWARAELRLRDGGDVRLPIDLCAVYWHFLLLIWILMLGLLITT